MSLPLSNFPTSTPMSLEPKPFQKGAKLISSEPYKVNIICETLDWDLYSLFNNTNIGWIKPTLLVSLLEQGVLWPLKTRLMSGWMVQLKTALRHCHKICEPLYSPLLFIGRTRTATFTLETLGLLSSMVPPDLRQMNEWIQATPVMGNIYLQASKFSILSPNCTWTHHVIFTQQLHCARQVSLNRQGAADPCLLLQ